MDEEKNVTMSANNNLPDSEIERGEVIDEPKKDFVHWSERVWSIFAYLWILCLVPFIVKRDSRFVSHHAQQGVMLFIAEVILGVVVIIPLIGWLIGFVGWILCTVWSIHGIISALAGRFWRVPYLGKIAKKIGF
ncbi:MAG: DUF4870 domain-containing protein [Candidatus Aenigmarchaeota archaeon]|nr:DUF4870 domain-containing protein [Candidatus Aenigmarchaeota archaeon]